MTTTFTPQKVRPPETATRPLEDAQTGLRRWTPDEYHRMAEMDVFDGARVELLDGRIWNVDRLSHADVAILSVHLEQGRRRAA